MTANSQQPTANSQQLKVLKQHFPACFDKNGAFLPAKLQSLVEANSGQISNESYSLNWLGKSYARLLANELPRTLLQADAAHNALHATSQNLLIQGDNLEVLKHLKGAYRNQVKMIYIDPPYNTGSDGFVYADNRKFTPAQLSHLAGINEDEARRVLDFTSRKSNSHSAWLTFMYPRLYIARELLRDDGVIFISIDDNEQAQLKLLCDEVFGEENFAGQFLRLIKKGGKSSDAISKNNDLLLCYTRTSTPKFYKLEHDDDGFKNSDEFIEDRGLYKLNQTLDYDTLGYVRTLDYEIKIGDENFYPGNVSKKEFLERREENPKDGYRWRWSKQLFDFGYENGFILVKKSKNGARIYTKTYQMATIGEQARGGYCVEYEDRTKALSSIDFVDNKFSNDNAKKEVQGLLGKGMFDYPKPVSLIEKLAKFSTMDDDLILDFFAGSGTTAHAVMQLNAEDGGKRRFICVQLDEATDTKSEAYKAGYKTIFDITRARISKAAAKIKTEHPDYAGDLAFKVFQTVPVFAGYQDEAEELTANLELFTADTLTEQDRFNLLLTWAVQDGIPLSGGVQGASKPDAVLPHPSPLPGGEGMPPSATLIVSPVIPAQAGIQPVFKTAPRSGTTCLSATQDASIKTLDSRLRGNDEISGFAGMPLTPINLAGYTAYQGGEAGRLLYFIHPALSLAVVIELLRRLDDEAGFAPKHLVVWGYGLDSKTQREMTEAVAHYSNRKNIELDLEVRF